MSNKMLVVTVVLAFTAQACLQFAHGSVAVEGHAGSRKLLLTTCGTSNYGQCGGLNCQGPFRCDDAPVGCCPDGFACSRQSEWYWQCLPTNGASGPIVTTIPRLPPTQIPVPTTSVPVRQCGGLVLSLYDQCGGETNCPSGVSCSDAQWSVGCCPTGYGCARESPYYWQCLPQTVTPSPTVYNVYDQCGGQSNCPSGTSCSDTQWSGKCTLGSQCTRATNWYWQCLPSNSNSDWAVSVLGLVGMEPWTTNFGNNIDSNAQWIWNNAAAASLNGIPANTVPISFTKSYFSAATAPIQVTIYIIVDDRAEVLLNSVSLGWAIGGWGSSSPKQLQGTIMPGDNKLEVRALNDYLAAGLLLSVKQSGQPLPLFHTDASWTWQ